MNHSEQTGVLLINLGTPAAPTVRAVKRFLRDFLSDPKVIELPALMRFVLVSCFIVPLRAKKTTALYQKIWTAQGSPLLHHSLQFKTKLAAHLGANYRVALGMRYGAPSVQSAYKELQHCKKLIVFPLFPQYSRATTETAILAVKRIISKSKVTHEFRVIDAFFNHPDYISALAVVVKKAKVQGNPDFILFSYHGLPRRALAHAGCEQVACDRESPCPVEKAARLPCYRAQCYTTTAELARALGLQQSQYASAFQSRLGRLPWIVPYSDEFLKGLRARGIKRLLMVCPSFVVDCLETLEEIDIRLRAQWMALGGEAFALAPCLNAQSHWVECAARILTNSVPCC